MMKKIALILLFAASVALPQLDMDGHMEGETFFHNAGIAVHLHGQDSVFVTIGAGSEDLQNTVGVFPYLDTDTVNFRLFEQKIEAYLQARVPVRVDGKRLFLKIVQWKPGGTGREDRLDMASLYVDNLFFTFAARLPEKRKMLDVTANMWVERHDASETVVQMSFFQDDQALKRVWTKRETTIQFPLEPDSLAAMRRNPPPPIKTRIPEVYQEVPDDHDDHSGHNH